VLKNIDDQGNGRRLFFTEKRKGSKRGTWDKKIESAGRA